MSADGERERLARENARLRARVAELERDVAKNADSAAFLESLLRAVPAFIARGDDQLRLRYMNRYQPGHGPEQALGRPLVDYIDPTQREHTRSVLEHTLRTGEPGRLEIVAEGAHGKPAYYESHVARVRDADGRVGLCIVALEVTQHKRREQALSESEEKLRVALEATGLGLWSWDITTGEVVWDDAMLRLHGCESPGDLQRYAERHVHPLDREEFLERAQRVIASGRWEATPYRIVRPDGEQRWMLSSGRVVADSQGRALRMMGGTLDVTTLRELEEQLRQAQKMEALGNLTAGIAHNFNNMLTVILPTLELAIPLVEPARQPLLREAAHAARRASELVRALMTFAGTRRSEVRTAQPISPIVDAAVGICRRAFDRGITLDVRYDGDREAAIDCNAGEIEQVLVNLLLNARDAVLEAGRDGGRVSVHVDTRGGDLPPLSHEGTRPRPAVRIEIADNGKGMSEQVRARAFEPFFSTKPVGQGTGLGLTTSYAIVREHNGALSCRSEPGVGTAFTIALPLSAARSAAVAPRVRQPAPRGLSVLLVDDESAVRAAVGQVLADSGFRVLHAASGRDALALLERERAIELVLLDRSMPDAPGESFVPRMREIAPRARILFFTGQAIDPELAALADGVVQKPVRGRDLLEAVGRTLSRGERPPIG